MDLPIDIVDIDDDDDDMSSVMSDVGLLEEIDFQWSDQTAMHFYAHIAPRLDWYRDANTTTNTTNHKDGPTTHPHPAPSDQQQQQHQQQQQRRRRRRNDRKRQLQLLLREQHDLELKCQERRDYLQRIQSHYPARLLQSIQQRQELASHRQRQVIRQDIASVQTTAPTVETSTPNDSTVAATTNYLHSPPHHSDHSHWFHQMTQYVLFEYYLTGPAAMAVLLHSIIFITLYDLLHDLVLVLYTDLVPGLYHWTWGVWSEYSISLQRWWLPPSITFGPVVVVVIEFITTWLETHVDTLYYITMFGVGVYGIHQSGYLYWWLSDYDYTILKFDTHNRIRLWLWRSHIPVHPTRIPVTAPVTSSTTSDTTIATTRTTNNPCITSTAIAGWNVRNNNYHNIPNSFVRQFHHVRQYPILRLVLYVTGYYIVYMISQVLVATTYPYFSQHDQILPHLPSLTFDKRLYHFVDKERHSIDDVRSDRQRDVFLCVVQNCRMEMKRQLLANQELIRAEHHYTKSRLAHLSYLGYWSTFLELYGEKSIYPLFDTIQNRFYTVDDDDDEEGEEEEEEEEGDIKETDAPLRDAEPIRRNHTSTIVDFRSTPVFDNTGEIVFAFVSLTIGIALLRGYGFVFWEKY